MKKIPYRKICKICKKLRHSSKFYKKETCSDGLYTACKKCYSRNSRVKYRKDPYKNQKNNRRSYLKRNYGLTLLEFRRMSKNQSNRCGICEKKKILCVDHNHKTNVLRGLLCHNCNLAIGNFFEDIKFIRNAIKYLKKYKK